MNIASIFPKRLAALIAVGVLTVGLGACSPDADEANTEEPETQDSTEQPAQQTSEDAAAEQSSEEDQSAADTSEEPSEEGFGDESDDPSPSEQANAEAKAAAECMVLELNNIAVAEEAETLGDVLMDAAERSAQSGDEDVMKAVDDFLEVVEDFGDYAEEVGTSDIREAALDAHDAYEEFGFAIRDFSKDLSSDSPNLAKLQHQVQQGEKDLSSVCLEHL